MVMNDMTDDGKWGAEIAVEGVRPAWLTAGDRFRVFSYEGEWSEPYLISGVTPYAWANDIRAIRLPADHPHYQQTQPINWTAPIEAVHEDGRVVPVTMRNTDLDDERYTYSVTPVLPGGHDWFKSDGSHVGCQWRIRNVATKPVRTAAEMLDRLEALARRMADGGFANVAPHYEEARALVAEMEPVVDGDVLIAREMRLEELGDCASEGYKAFMNSGHYDNDDDVQKFVRAIRRGRELARGEG